MLNKIRVWWRRRQHDQDMQGRCAEFASNPYSHTKSPWIRSLIASPMFNQDVRAKGVPRVIEVTDARKATGRDYINDLLRIERCIRFRHYRWAWQGIFTAMADDLLEAVYAEERARIFLELMETCPDEKLWGGQRRSLEAAKGVIGGYVNAATRSLPASSDKSKPDSQKPEKP